MSSFGTYVRRSTHLKRAVTGIHIGADWSDCCHGGHETGLVSTVDGDHTSCRGTTTILVVAAHALLEGETFSLSECSLVSAAILLLFQHL